MLSINPQVSSANYQNNHKSNLNFKSSFVPTEYLAKGFDTAITEGYQSKNFLKAIKGFLNDGLNRVIKIDGTPGSEIRPGSARLHDIFVDGKKVVDGESQLDLIFDGSQCVDAIKEFARKNNVMDYKIPADAPDEIAKILREEVAESNMSEVVFEQITDKIKVLKEDYGKQIGAELMALKNKIFS